MTLTRALGWFSIGLGLAELVAPGALGRFLGVPHRRGLIRGFGARELAAGLGILRGPARPFVWSRVAGDLLDLAALGAALRRTPRRRNVALATVAVLGATALDVVAATA
jgi:hypothetical protein